MPISVRLLRASLQPELDQRLPLKPRERQRREAILEFGQKNMAEFGRPNLSFARFAEAIRLSPHTIKRLFADLDALLGDILRRHLTRISKTLGDIPPDTPDRAARQRQAYLAATRKPLGGFNDAHLLLLRDRHFLPADELASVEAARDGIATLLGGELGQQTLDLLDAPSLSPAQIEFLLTHLPQAPRNAEPPAETQAPPEPDPTPLEPPQTEQPQGYYLTYPGHPKHPDDPPFFLPIRNPPPTARAGPG